MSKVNILEEGKYTGKVVQSFRRNGIIVSTTEYPKGGHEGGLHSHTNPHICYIIQGGDIETRHNVPYNRKTGEIFFYYSGELHQTLARAEHSKNINIELDTSILKTYRLDEQHIDATVKKNIDTKFLALKLLEEMHLSDAISPTAIDLLTINLLTYATHEKKLDPPRWANQLHAVLNDRWDEQISLSELSQLVGAHPVTISKGFKKYFLCTYGTYMRKLKIDRSIHYIQNTNQSLTEIAYTCGFSDQSHFTRAFKKSIGFLPKHLRSL